MTLSNKSINLGVLMVRGFVSGWAERAAASNVWCAAGGATRHGSRVTNVNSIAIEWL